MFLSRGVQKLIPAKSTKITHGPWDPRTFIPTKSAKNHPSAKTTKIYIWEFREKVVAIRENKNPRKSIPAKIDILNTACNLVKCRGVLRICYDLVSQSVNQTINNGTFLNMWIPTNKTASIIILFTQCQKKQRTYGKQMAVGI